MDNAQMNCVHSTYGIALFGQQTDKCNLFLLIKPNLSEDNNGTQMYWSCGWTEIRLGRSSSSSQQDHGPGWSREIAEVLLEALIEANYSIAQSKRQTKIEQHFN